MLNKYAIYKNIDRLHEQLLHRQLANGSWSFCFENGIITDAYMVLLLKTMKSKHQKLIHSLLTRILTQQSANGSWKLFADEEGNLSATIEACLALLYGGIRKASDSELQKAKAYIISQTGRQKVNQLTKTVLSLFGHHPWPTIPQLPLELMLLPISHPYNLSKIVGFGRVHVVPIMILHHQKRSIALPLQNEVNQWLVELLTYEENEKPLIHREEVLRYLPPYPTIRKSIKRKSLQKALQFIWNHLEPDGTLYSYMTATFFMIFALHAVGYPLNHDRIRHAVQGLLSFNYSLSPGISHLQETTSTVWDTALILYALQESGLSAHHPSIQQGLRYLLQRQQTKKGDWSIHNPLTEPGGWGFSDINTINPDLDDTSACLRALTPSIHKSNQVQASWYQGTEWLLTMQNKDGGWSAFEKDTDPLWMRNNAKLRHVLADPSSSDLTGRTLEFLGNFTDRQGLKKHIQSAANWLFRHQKANGSWYGRWGICYIYGTWAALTGLAATGLDHSHPNIKKGIRWLLSIQNKDGGWGESCDSDRQQRYVPLGKSTLVQTAWALDALICYHERPTEAIHNGVTRLLELLQDPEQEAYPTGAGFAGQFYIRYHSYPYVWPLVTLGHLQYKYLLDN